MTVFKKRTKVEETEALTDNQLYKAVCKDGVYRNPNKFLFISPV